ncbi:MAG: A24 family peptidase [Bryobacteraceae bacterium]|jgi:prepilin peptidase CpaA
MQFPVPPRGVEIVLVLVVLAAAAFDIRFRRIPNWLTAGGVVAGIALNAFLNQARPGLLLGSLEGLLLGLGVYLVLYAIRAMGAGDAKLMGAVGALAGWQDWFGIFIVTAVIGGVMAVVFALSRGRLKTTFWNVGFILTEMTSGRAPYLKKEELDVRSPKAIGLPHGAVIAVGTLVFLGLAAFHA